MSSPFNIPCLGEILVSKGFVDTVQIDHAIANGQDLIGKKLLDKHQITDEQLAEGLAEQARLPYISLENHVITPELLNVFVGDFIYRHNIVPIAFEHEKLVIAVSDPYDSRLLNHVQRLTDHPIQFVVSSFTAIVKSLEHSKKSSNVIQGVSDDFDLAMVVESDEGNETVVALDKTQQQNADSPVIKLINTILLDAIHKRVSDIHVETYENKMVVKYRVDGVLYVAAENLSNLHHPPLISRLKVMAELDIAEKRTPQDGRFKLRYLGRDIDCRISILPGIFGEDIVIRILDELAIADGMENLTLEKIGIMPAVLKRFRHSILEPYGMVLITGPTGSGKTTTLYAALSELNTGEEKIITIEDPVEYQLDGIVQIPVNEKKGLTFAKGLRSILRHDPDKILVGEIRDTETAQITVQSAMTGHLVLSTVHANNAIDVVGRFTHMGVDLYNFVSALNCVMAQRLIRKICPHCRQTTTIDDSKLAESGLDSALYKDQVWYEGAGCSECNETGYLGRTVITEFLDLTPELREMILNKRPTAELYIQAKQQGMQSLRESAIEQVCTGQTTLKEANRVTFVD